MNPRFLVTGANGQVGQALQQILGEQALVLGRDQLNLENPDSLRLQILKLRPEVVINAAAYTKVDQAESEEALAFRINAEAPLAMAKACYEIGASFLTYSTDYVYSGEGLTPWRENDPIAPQNAYGRTKAAGERLILDWAPADFKFLILRTSWVYSFVGKNFVLTMLKLGAEREELNVVSDQVGAPTYAPELAATSLEMIKKLTSSSIQSGVYNACSSGETSWHGFAQEIFKQAGDLKMPVQVKRLLPLESSQYPTLAKRPLNSRMSLEKLGLALGQSTPHWKVGLKQCLWQIKSSAK
jgi:dTDP-4-dehydrorhamnose reductase